jgi:integrase
MARSRNGSGTLVQRKDGIWQGQLQVAGRRRTIYGKTKAEAKSKLEALQREALVYGAFPQNRSLFELLDHWFAQTEGGLKPATRHRYRRCTRVIEERLGDLPLAKLTPDRLQALYAAHRDRPRLALHLHAALHRALRLAVLWGWLTQNPADRVLRPSYRQTERTLWSVEDCRVFLGAIEGGAWMPLWTVALESGCRYGELIGLRWADVDWDRGVLRIERSLQRIGREWAETSPKTASGRRQVYIGPPAVQALRKQRARQAEWRLLAGPAWEDTGRVFTSRTGGPLEHSGPTQALARLCRRLGLPVISMHAFRHLHASLALQAGAPIALVFRQLGHANVSITTSIYSHAIGDGGLIQEALQRALAGGAR